MTLKNYEKNSESFLAKFGLFQQQWSMWKYQYIYRGSLENNDFRSFWLWNIMKKNQSHFWSNLALSNNNDQCKHISIRRDSLENNYLGHFEENILWKNRVKFAEICCYSGVFNLNMSLGIVLCWKNHNFRHFEGGEYVYEINIVKFG